MNMKYKGNKSNFDLKNSVFQWDVNIHSKANSTKIYSKKIISSLY